MTVCLRLVDPFGRESDEIPVNNSYLRDSGRNRLPLLSTELAYLRSLQLLCGATTS